MAFKRTVTLRASFRFPAIRFDAPTLLSFSGFTHAPAKCPPVAVEAFKLSLEKLAKGQGKRRADMYFATINKTNPSDILKSAYENLVAVNKFDEVFPSLEDYQELQAQAVMGISRDDRVSKTELLRRANMPCIKALIMKPKLRGLDMWFERTTRAFRRWSSSLTWLPVRVTLDTH